MAEQPNIFGYMRISTQEERQKQRYNRQEYALNKYAQGNDFEYVLGSVKMYPLKILLIASNEQILSGFFSLGILLFLKTSHALPGKLRQGMRSTWLCCTTSVYFTQTHLAEIKEILSLLEQYGIPG